MQKNSIETYKIFKKIIMKQRMTEELNKELKFCNKKEKEVLFWKSAFDRKLEEKLK